jgi:hypothetical protein
MWSTRVLLSRSATLYYIFNGDIFFPALPCHSQRTHTVIMATRHATQSQNATLTGTSNIGYHGNSHPTHYVYELVRNETVHYSNAVYFIKNPGWKTVILLTPVICNKRCVCVCVLEIVTVVSGWREGQNFQLKEVQRLEEEEVSGWYEICVAIYKTCSVIRVDAQRPLTAVFWLTT